MKRATHWRRYLIIVLYGPTLATAQAADGVIAVKSPFNVDQTAQQLEHALRAKGASVIASVDHAAAAAKVGMRLRPTRVVIFGNPRAGTPLMQCAQTAGIDLPQKALVWEDETGQTWVGYNDVSYLAKRHNLRDCDAAIKTNAEALANIVQQATANSPPKSPARR